MDDVVRVNGRSLNKNTFNQIVKGVGDLFKRIVKTVKSVFEIVRERLALLIATPIKRKQIVKIISIKNRTKNKRIKRKQSKRLLNMIFII